MKSRVDIEWTFGWTIEGFPVVRPNVHSLSMEKPSARFTSRTTLGYNEAARLAFLRREHADPIDIDVRGAGNNVERADTSLPDFADYTVSDDLSKKWDEFRAESDLAFLRALYAVSHPTGGKMAAALTHILVQQRRADWGRPGTGAGTAPRPPSPPAAIRWTTTGNIALQCRGALEGLGRTRKWDGFVLELPSGIGIKTPAPPKTAGQELGGTGRISAHS